MVNVDINMHKDTTLWNRGYWTKFKIAKSKYFSAPWPKTQLEYLKTTSSENQKNPNCF